MVNVSASPSNFTTTWVSASTTTEPESIPIVWNFPLSYEEELKRDALKEIERLKECKMRNKLKRKNIFTKKGLY